MRLVAVVVIPARRFYGRLAWPLGVLPGWRLMALVRPTAANAIGRFVRLVRRHRCGAFVPGLPRLPIPPARPPPPAATTAPPPPALAVLVPHLAGRPRLVRRFAGRRRLD